MRDMFLKDIIPFLQDKSSVDDKKNPIVKIRKSTLLTTDISETEIEERIKDLVWEAKRDSIDIGITATPGLTKIILVERTKKEPEAADKLKAFEKKICSKLGGYVYGRGNTLISDNLKSAVEKAGKPITISAAESITGGLISSIITDTPGSSKFFKGGVVSYSESAKEDLLNIDRKLIESKGAVSREVCIQMAKV